MDLKIGCKVKFKDNMAEGIRYGEVFLFDTMLDATKAKSFHRILEIDDDGCFIVEDCGYWFSPEMVDWYKPNIK